MWAMVSFVYEGKVGEKSSVSFTMGEQGNHASFILSVCYIGVGEQSSVLFTRKG